MAAISTVTLQQKIGAAADRPAQIRNSVALAAGTYVDWISVPAASRWVEIFYDVSALAGGGTLLPALVGADPIIKDDARTVAVATLTTAQTAAAAGRIVAGPGIVGSSSLVWGANAGVDALVNTVLPRLLGIKTTVAVGTATFKVSVRFLGDG